VGLIQLLKEDFFYLDTKFLLRG